MMKIWVVGIFLVAHICCSSRDNTNAIPFPDNISDNGGLHHNNGTAVLGENGQSNADLTFALQLNAFPDGPIIGGPRRLAEVNNPKGRKVMMRLNENSVANHEATIDVTAHAMWAIAWSNMPFNDKWAKLQRVGKRKDVLARIRKNATKLGLSRDDFHCVSVSLGIPQKSCPVEDPENFSLLSYWKLVRCLKAFLYQRSSDRPVKMDERAYVMGTVFFQDADPLLWSRLNVSPYYKKEAATLINYLDNRNLEIAYEHSIVDYEKLFSGDITNVETRQAMARKFIEIPPSKAVAIITEVVELEAQYFQKFEEAFTEAQHLMFSICSGLSVERRNVSARAITIFSLNHLAEAEEVLFAFGSRFEIPSNITESLRDAIISESLDGAFAKNMAPYCYVLANQNDVQDMETTLRASSTPKERAKSIVIYVQSALNMDVSNPTRKEILKRLDPALEDLRTVVASCKGNPKITDGAVDCFLTNLSLEKMNNSAVHNCTSTILEDLSSEIERKMDAIIDRRQPKDYIVKKAQTRKFGEKIKKFHSTKTIELKGDAKRLTKSMMESNRWRLRDYKQIRSLESLANELANKATEQQLQKLYKDAASTLGSYAAAAAWMADEFKSLDYIWISIDSTRGDVPNETRLKGYFHAFIMTTTSGTNHHVLKEYFRQHAEHVSAFVNLLKQSTKLRDIGTWLENAPSNEKIDWVDVGQVLKDHYTAAVERDGLTSVGLRSAGYPLKLRRALPNDWMRQRGWWPRVASRITPN